MLAEMQQCVAAEFVGRVSFYKYFYSMLDALQVDAYSSASLQRRSRCPVGSVGLTG